jgi:hypothetical protein
VNKLNRTKYAIVYIGILLLQISCTARKIQTLVQEEVSPSKIDYSNLENWAAHPVKKDESDTLIKQGQSVEEKSVDVFYVHPTTLTGKIKGGYINGSLQDTKLNKKTDESAIRFQASAFNVVANIYAPRYRQAHINMYQEKDTIKRNEVFRLAYNDVKNAFEYYLENFNNGKPFIIASHSQGTTHAKKLIKELIDQTPLKEKMIAAYLIGMPVLKNEFQNISICKDSVSTNCFVSWRTFRNDYEDTWANRLDTNIAVVNPVTWNSTEEIASKSQHKGAVLYNMNKIYRGTHETQAEGSGLWISKPKFPGSFLYKSKNYHIGDINLFYIDIRNNVVTRTNTYRKKNGITNQ